MHDWRWSPKSVFSFFISACGAPHAMLAGMKVWPSPEMRIGEKMANRIRKKQIIIRVTEEEEMKIRRKISQAKMGTFQNSKQKESKDSFLILLNKIILLSCIPVSNNFCSR